MSDSASPTSHPGWEDHLRRPDMCITEFNHVRLSVANPHHAGLTQAEIRLLEVIDADPATEAT
jgi:hypothetical protein